MLNGPVVDRLSELFPGLRGSAPTWQRLLQSGAAVHLPPDAHICIQGQRCSHLALVLEGTARVYKLGESGREITLYRIDAGECCILTASCILSQGPFPAFAVAETEVRGVLLPAERIRDWMAADPTWRDYLWRLLADRLGEVIGLVEEVAFKRMDLRIAQDLLRRLATTGSDTLRITHQQIAADLGTSREVVSRILKDLEARGAVTLGRGSIRVRDSDRLRRLEEA